TEPSVKSATPTDLNLTSVAQTTTATSFSLATTLLASTAQGITSTAVNPFSSPRPLILLTQGQDSPSAFLCAGQEPERSESTTTAATQGTSEPVTLTPMSSGYLPVPTPTDDKSPLTVAAFGVISFIVILIVVVIILVSVVSLRFKCNRSKDSE
ncbi:hypothetical protein N339_04338, partial [Pterocles gutturalis]